MDTLPSCKKRSYYRSECFLKCHLKCRSIDDISTHSPGENEKNNSLDTDLSDKLTGRIHRLYGGDYVLFHVRDPFSKSQAVVLMSNNQDISHLDQDVPTYKIVVYERDQIRFARTLQSPIPPSVVFHPQFSGLFTITSFPGISSACVNVQTYDITSGNCIWARDFPDVAVDWDAVVHVGYNRDGSRLIIAVHEPTAIATEYIFRCFAVDLSSNKVILKSRATLLHVCHGECVINAQPVVTSCGGYVMMPTAKDCLITKLPEENTLKAIARKNIVQILKRTIGSDMTEQLEIPETLKLFMMFR